ncbi:RagB/SusD family nutrient uptake outer membrane protein [Flectobacillus sp. BAB-3569]|uniref:RagB/SusD family nutrient uptake outer membrane protein n=1 Tax=Flectobacillus sp. BAB-3569 TaxID=1509483 RepID=UPI000BA39387|nr:RagB/SusD family nutrient uptake outer membrane protein [Flectobacillus sp. BAB-3569]PAC31989.1 RagB/SusD family nutrient uptake outer membrane protein [Flectobacillus sp. BAB-3569]
MKRYSSAKKAIVATLTLTTLVFSCKEDTFLTVLPTGSLAQAQLSTKAGVEGALLGAYSMLAGKGYTRFAGPNNWVYGSILGGDANKGTDPGDYTAINPIQRYEAPATDGDINGSWNAKYEGISRANTTIRLATASTELSDADKKRIIAEARVLRGHFYFELKKIFNSVPYVDETKDYGTGIEKVANTPDFWDKIEADFKAGMDNLPETLDQAGRVNKWAAASYLGKTYLFEKKYTEAKAIFDQVIANGKTTNGKKYGLVAKYAEIFNAENDNHEESIFAVQTSMNTGSTNNSNAWDDLNYPYNTGANGPGNCCGFFQPSFSLANSFRTDANGLPLLDGSYNTGSNQLVNDYGVESNAAFTPDKGNLDPRIDHSIGRRGIPYLDWIDHPGKDWIRSQPYAGPYSPKKYVYYKTQENTLTDGSSWTRGYATMNYTIIRFADVLLMAAEAEVEVGSLEKAREYVNRVRARAANPSGFVTKAGKPAANYVISLYNTAWTDKAVARKAVRFERKLELSGEGHRFFDLVRWGEAATELNAYLAYESKFLVTMFGGAKFTANKNEYLPIPQTQIDIQGKDILKQNPGY